MASACKGPFPLITTPNHTLPKAEHNAFTKAASEMVVVHNGFIRMLNSIYLQAPHIRELVPDGIADFIRYCHFWSLFLHLHHSLEENHLFPNIEKATGIKGIMDTNVSQHRAFDEGLGRYDDYIAKCIDDPSLFTGSELNRIIDLLVPVLLQHLNDEIPTLLGLAKYADRLDIMALMDEEGKIAMASSQKYTGAAGWAMNFDASFEDGVYAGFPPIPWLVRIIIWYSWTWPNRAALRFSSCGRNRLPRKRLLAEPGEKA